MHEKRTNFSFNVFMDDFDYVVTSGKDWTSQANGQNSSKWTGALAVLTKTLKFVKFSRQKYFQMDNVINGMCF